MAENRFKYKITAEDESAKGVKSAEKGVGRLTGATKKYEGAVEASRKVNGGRAYGIAASEISHAAGRLASSVPAASRYSSAVGEIGRAATTAATGVTAAARAGSGLSSVLGGIITTGAGAVGVVAAVAGAAATMTTGWVNSTAQLYRMSQAMGIAFEDLQKLQAAGEQFGIDKNAATEGIAGIGSTLHQAAYGGNNEALAAENRLGLRVNKTADGQVDVKDFTLQLSDAISKQKDPYTQAHIAQIFGASSLLPMLRQGRGAVQSAMDDAGRHAGVLGSQDGRLAVSEYQKGVQIKQLADRAAAFGEAGVARAGEGVLDATLQKGREVADGARGAIRSSIDTVTHTAVKDLGDASRYASGHVQQFGGVLEQARAQLARAAEAGEQRTGVPALVTIAQAGLESGHLKHMPPGSNNPFGIKAKPGEPFVMAMTSEKRNGKWVRELAPFRKFASIDEAVRAHDDLLAHGRPYATARSKMDDPYAFAEAISGRYATDDKYAGKLQAEMHRVEVHVYDHRTTATVKDKRGRERAVAVGHAMRGDGP